MNAGRIYQIDLKYKAKIANKLKLKYKHHSAFTLIELLFTIAIISICYLVYDNSTTVTKNYYYHRSQLFEKRINELLSVAKNASIISNKKVSICPVSYSDENTETILNIKLSDSSKHHLRCTPQNWHNPIIVFYSDYKKYLSYTDIIIYKNPILTKNEKITLNLFSKEKTITFDPSKTISNLNGTIIYKNIYYNNSIRINKAGSSRIK